MARHLIDGDLSPIISSVSPGSLIHSTTYDLVINGDYFRSDAIVTVGGSFVNTVTFVNARQLIVNITTSAGLGLYDVTVEIPNIGSSIAVDAVKIIVVTYKDLRLGGDVFTDGNGAGNNIRYKTGMNLVRDAAGMYFQGAAPWSSWVKFEISQRTRGDQKTLEWIFTNSAANMMIGIGSDQTNEASTAQYTEAEVEAYFNSSTNRWGLYGNNGTPGVSGNQGGGAVLTAGSYWKLKFENDGSRGGLVFLYKLPTGNIGDWPDESNLIAQYSVGNTLDPKATNLFPFIIPENGSSQRFIAYTVY